ncbi:MAG TPA: RAMP superfamily CRISPR-associated protein, partial [Chloroflexota bacterium]|nr:RAMP superfamily CRISPR-associated protein [Chloroflexota bacterium]
RVRLEGDLVARGPLHVGGVGGSSDVDMALAVDGQGRFVIPGTSLAGALRGSAKRLFGDTKDLKDLWGSAPGKGQRNSRDHASRVIIEAALVTLPAGLLVEIREGVGIDRCSGTAAEHIKYNRAVLPRGSRIRLSLTIEAPEDQREDVYELVGALVRRLKDPGIRIGAARTRGLGLVRLEGEAIRGQSLANRPSTIEALRHRSSGKGWQDLSGNLPGMGAGSEPWRELQVVVDWKPDGPVMVKAEGAGVAVDMLPLLSGIGDDESGLAMVIPGSSIKGALRAQAERICRTVTEQDAPKDPDPRQRFLHQMQQFCLVEALFGAARKQDQDGDSGSRNLKDVRAGDRPTADEEARKANRVLPGVGALAVDDCYATHAPTSRQQWSAVESAEDSQDLREALDRAHLPQVQQAFHVA